MTWANHTFTAEARCNWDLTVHAAPDDNEFTWRMAVDSKQVWINFLLSCDLTTKLTGNHYRDDNIIL